MFDFFKKTVQIILVVVVFYFALVLSIAEYFDRYFWPLTPPPTPGTWTTIQNPQYNFSVEYPVEWDAQIYDELGFKGSQDLKLRVYQPSFMGRSMFRIGIYYQDAETYIFKNVIDWGYSRFAQSNRRLREQGVDEYEEFALWEDNINGYGVTRRRYGNDEIMHEHVYIARGNDMFIIDYQNHSYQFESMYDDVQKVIKSFQPLE